MKVLIITQYFWPENFRINELASELKNKGHEVIVLTGLPNYPEGKIYKNYRENKNKYKTMNGIKILRVPIIPRRKGYVCLVLNYFSFALSATILGTILLRKVKPDLIFVFQTSPVLVGIPSSIISKIKKVPQIFWVLDLWPETLEAIGVFKKKWQSALLKILIKWIYSSCSLILCQSKSFVKNINKFVLENDKVRFFPAWDDIVVKDNQLSKENNLKLNNNFLNIMYAGNVGYAQDFPSLIKAIEILKKEEIKYIKFHIIGDGRMKDYLEKSINNLNLEKYIKLHNKYPLNAMNEIFEQADILFVSLRNEKVFSMTIPGKIQSYLNSGKPILGMLNGEGADIINISKSGLTCNAGDYLQLSKLVKKFKNLDINTLNRMGINGKIFYQKEFDKDKLINKLINFFNETLQKD